MIDRALKIVLAAALFVFFTFSLYRPIEFEDGWWHLATGRWIVEHKAVPHEDPFSFSDRKAPWVLTQWLGSSAYYLAYLAGGYEGLKIFRAFLCFCIIGLFIYYSRRQLPYPLLIALICCLFCALLTRCLMRPDLFNYLFVQLFLIRILGYARDRNPRRLWMLPALGCLWGNLHLGSFVFGSLLIGVAVLSGIIGLFNDYLDKNRAAAAQHFVDVKLYALIFVLYLCSFVVSPYGIQALIYPLRVFFDPAFINIYKFVNVVAEALPPNYIFTWSGCWGSALILGGIAAIVLMKRDKFLSAMLFAFPLFLFLRGRRASVFFALAAVYVIVECARQRSWKAWWEARRYAWMADAVLSIFLIFFFSVQTAHAWQKTVFMQGSLKKEWRLDFAYRNPVRAVQFLLDHHIEGKVFANDVVGGYVLWSGYPRLRPFIDGRQLDQKFFAQYLEILREGPAKSWDAIEAEHRFTIILLDTSLDSSYALAVYLFNTDRWKLVFVDGPVLVYVRRDAFALPAGIDHFDDRLRSTALSWDDVRKVRELALDPARPVADPPVYVDILDEGATLFGVGYRGEGVHRIFQGAAVNPAMARGVAAGVSYVISYEMD